MTSIEMALMVETPQARPSRPSMRLTAFVIPTIHKTVMGMDSQPRSQYGLSAKTFGLESVWITTPWNTATSAAKICTQNLKYARSGDISSTTPKTTMMDAPSKMPCNWWSTLTNSSMLTIKPRKIARPPRRGTGFLCMRRLSFGTSIAPIL